MSCYSRVVADLADFLATHHSVSPFLEGAERPGTSTARVALAIKMGRLRESVALLMMTEIEDTPATITALVWLDAITRHLDLQYDAGKAIELNQEDKQRLDRTLELLKAADSPEGTQAPVSDRREGTGNLSTPSGESTPEADADVWISFAKAHEVTALESFEITRVCDSGKVRSQGKRKGRQVHLGDLVRFMLERGKNGR